MIEEKNDQLTTIQVKKSTLKRLKMYKIVNKESYEELINRLMDEYKEE